MIAFRRVLLPDDTSRLEALLCGNNWPFHARSHLDADAVQGLDVLTDDVDSHWIVDGERTVGLIRLLDLADLDVGSPRFDLRIDAGHRGRGLGTEAVRWLTGRLFDDHATLHRIEATTRHDNVVMQRVLARCGYRQEGRMREAWVSDDGTRYDALVYAILRREWSPGPAE